MPPPSPSSLRLDTAVEAVLLAGGLSQRMGRDKARLRIAGRTLSARSGDAARSLGFPVRVLRKDSVPRCGPLGGVFTALNRARARVILFLSCDMPLVQPSLIQRLLARLGTRHSAAFTECEGWLGFPFALRVDAATTECVRRHLEPEHRSLQHLARDLAAVQVSIPVRAKDQLLNVNTPEALDTFCKSLAPSRPRRGFHASIASLFLTAFSLISLRAELPIPEAWLPTNTLAFLTIPDASALESAWSSFPPGRLWADPAMAAFRNHAESATVHDVEAPISEITGLPLGELPALARGQVTLAWIDESATRATNFTLRPLFLLDAGTNVAALDAWLRNPPPGKPASGVQIRGVPFSRRLLPRTELQPIWDRVFPKLEEMRSPASASDATPLSLFVGRSDSHLLASTSTNALANALERLANGAQPRVPPTAVLPGTLLRGSLSIPPLLRLLSSTPLSIGALTGPDAGPSFARIAAALGITQLRQVQAAVRSDAAGWYVDWRLAIPEGARKGLFAMLPFQPLDAAPPAFIPALCQEFLRLRIPGAPAWGHLEGLLKDIDPALLGVLQIFTGYAGKTDDADFDFYKGIIDRLGNDWIWAKVPAAGPSGSASLLVVGSPKADELLHGVRLVASPTYLATFFPPDTPPPHRTQRTVQGQSVTSIELPPMPWSHGATGAFHFAERQGFVAFASDLTALSGFLAPHAPSSLAQHPAFRDAARRVGGTDHGYFGFSDERPTGARLFEAYRRSPHALSQHFSWIAISPTATGIMVGLEDRLDGSLLPPFEKVATHFGPRFTRGKSTPDALEWTTFRPTTTPKP